MATSYGNAPRHFVGGTAVFGASGPLSPGWNSLHRAGDVALLAVVTPVGVTASLSSANGFTLIGSSTNGSDNAGARLAVYWCRADATTMAGNGGIMPAPVVTFTGDHCWAQVLGFRGCKTQGSPINTFSTGNNGTTPSTSLTIPGLTTTTNDCLVVALVATGVDSAAPSLFSGWDSAGGDIHYLAEWTEDGTSVGHGGGIAIADGIASASGALGNITATRTSGLHAWLAVALEPLQTIAPTATLVSPTDGTTYPSTSWVVDVTGEHAGLQVSHGSVGPETIHDGANFRGAFSSCSRAAITDGYRYTMTRRGGFAGLPTFEPIQGRRS